MLFNASQLSELDVLYRYLSSRTHRGKLASMVEPLWSNNYTNHFGLDADLECNYLTVSLLIS